MIIPKSENYKFFYNKDGVTVRDSLKKDILPLASSLRESDVDEIWASHHLRPLEALMTSYEQSRTCFTGLINEEPFSIFGCTPESSRQDKALIWMLATDRISDVRLEFLRYSRHFVDLLLEDYPMLYNFVDARNLRSIAWLRRIGARINESRSYGIDNLPFHCFYFERSN